MWHIWLPSTGRFAAENNFQIASCAKFGDLTALRLSIYRSRISQGKAPIMSPMQLSRAASVCLIKFAVCCLLTCGVVLPQTNVPASRQVRPRRVHPLPDAARRSHWRPPAPDKFNRLRAFQPSRAMRLLDFFRQTEASGFIDVYYSYNFNRPFNDFNVTRNYDIRHNGFKLNLAESVFEKKPTADSRLGFRFDINFGASRDVIHAAEPGRRKAYRVMQQAYGSYLASVGSGLQVDVGKFVTWMGAEVIETKDNWNYSRSLLFVYAIPTYHLGARARYAFNDKVSVLGAVVNGWNNVEENNRGKSYGFALTLTPTKKLSFTQNYIAGPEQPNDTRHKRQVFDTILGYNFSDRFAVLGNYDYGFDTLADGRKARWQGVAVAARYAPTQRVAVSPRVEWFNDYDGFPTGAPQRLREATLTGDYRVRPDLLFRAEARYDWSNQPFFNGRNPSALRSEQTTVLGSVIYTFSSRPAAANAPPDPTPTPQP
jgi:hypothetical protein